MQVGYVGFGYPLQILTFFDVVINLILSQSVCGSAGTEEVDCVAAQGNILLIAVRLTLITLLLIKWNEDS